MRKESEQQENDDVQSRWPETELQLEAVEECALQQAYYENLDTLSDLKNELGGEMDVIASALEKGGIRGKTPPSVSYPRFGENKKFIIRQIAVAELKRFEKLGSNAQTYCSRHSLDEHKKALRSIIKKLPEYSREKGN